MSAILVTRARNGFIVQPYSMAGAYGQATDLSTVSVFAEGEETAIAAALKDLLAPPQVPTLRAELTSVSAALDVPAMPEPVAGPVSV